MGKKHIRVLGIDDAAFKFTDKSTLVVGAVVRLPMYIEAVFRTDVEVDGIDATDKIMSLIMGSRYKAQLKLVMIDGIALGGFNIVDIKKLYSETALPVVTITRDKPDFNAIKSALRKHFKDWKTRYKLISGRVVEIPTAHNPLYVKYVGIDLNTLKYIIAQSTVHGVLPEPIRIAHLIATGIKTGESYGKA